MPLQEEIEQRSKEIFTDSYPMSIGELMNLYTDNELDIHPEFQRFFRWEIDQKSKFIESLFLGIPIPSIFVSQRDDGVWDVIDGLQRLSTIFQFVGILKDENDELILPDPLTETKYLPSLKNKKWNDKDNPINSLTPSQRLLLKRQKIDIKILKHNSDPQVKYELFQRINSLGTHLSDQELRNCVLIMVDKSFYNWILELSQTEDFQNCVSLSDKDISEQYDIELVLRFCIFKNINMEEIGADKKNISDFITEKSIKFTNQEIFNREYEKNVFKKTFELLNNILGERTFKRYNKEKDKFEGKFLVTTFEAISIGVGSNIDYWDSIPDEEEKKEILIAKVKELWENESYTDSTVRGARWDSRSKVLVRLGKHLFNQTL